jgi:hypothetical protein
MEIDVFENGAPIELDMFEYADMIDESTMRDLMLINDRLSLEREIDIVFDRPQGAPARAPILLSINRAFLPN